MNTTDTLQNSQPDADAGISKLFIADKQKSLERHKQTVETAHLLKDIMN